MTERAARVMASLLAINERDLEATWIGDEDTTLERMFRYFTLETGLAAGCALLLLGLISRWMNYPG